MDKATALRKVGPIAGSPVLRFAQEGGAAFRVVTLLITSPAHGQNSFDQVYGYKFRFVLLRS